MAKVQTQGLESPSLPKLERVARLKWVPDHNNTIIVNHQRGVTCASNNKTFSNQSNATKKTHHGFLETTGSMDCNIKDPLADRQRSDGGTCYYGNGDPGKVSVYRRVSSDVIHFARSTSGSGWSPPGDALSGRYAPFSPNKELPPPPPRPLTALARSTEITQG